MWAILALVMPLAGRGAEDRGGAEAWPPPRTVEEIALFLRTGPKEFNPNAHALAKDRLLTRLAAGNTNPPGLLCSLCGVMEDTEADPIARVYIAQYLSLLIPRASPKGGEMPAEATEAVASLHRMATSPEPLLSATALLQLGELCRQDSRLDASRVKQIALACLNNPDAAPAPTISALQVCALLSVEEALPIAWARLAARRTAGEQTSAYRAIGALGGLADLERLKTLVNHSFPDAREQAVRQLESRLNIPPIGEKA